MHIINNQLCYSPQPPEAYGELGLGHGPLCRGDLQLWNLIYLSYPSMDGYLTAADKRAYYRTMPIDWMAGCMSTLRGEYSKTMFPTLREALQKPPTMFVDALMAMDWHLLPMQRLNPLWINVVKNRAYDIEMLPATSYGKGLPTWTLSSKLH